ncbi:HD domain-containing protein [Kitasatospora aureofaciens]|uniref:HD domain-containing protein n=1 Tax=Kitasatospora aureofaciens TaxID=1894 RepID=UPI001C43A975|nr:HD domain-containing protein [Kitasatospora aureofaciens]MBV6695635.1 HD domain-containing protein [Kitasatospora aureofaciens]
MTETLPQWARRIVEQELAETLPRRWSHSQGVTRQAEHLAAVAGADDGLLVAAAVLHDVGYAAHLAPMVFHPLDGARLLRDEHGVGTRFVRPGTNHSLAVPEVEDGLRRPWSRSFRCAGAHVVLTDLTDTDSVIDHLQLMAAGRR